MRRGFTLIETTISLAILSILLVTITSMLFGQISLYKHFVEKDKCENYSKEALRFIQTQVQDIKNSEVEIDENKLIVRKENGDMNMIYKVPMKNNKNKIIIEYYKKIQSVKKKVSIIENIEDFKIYRNKNVIFFSIENRDGEKYEKCIGVREKVS
ncbi:type II secretion system protein [Clostridium brassicae]|uniref:Type II secretion system protein n=1 Tax=Clostridium brassicae TaxID=2999072 RepID=A0ABT4DDT3_9CLOT|nr:type II secretion system protein [Clostridium brassicae]MCY6960470.1 type II secretion system protein [Clostridium brassicae]